MTTATRSSKVGANVHVRLEFDADETLPTGTPRDMGFQLVETQDGYAYKAYDDASRAIVDQVRANGFAIDPQTLEITFEKKDWSGPFGAYLERPGQNRPSFTSGIDHRRKHPILAPFTHLAGVGEGQAAFPAQITGAVEFGNVHYVCIYGRLAYKMENWSAGAPYFTQVYQHSDAAAVLRDMKVYDDTMYIAAGPKPYAYTENGADYTESNRAGTLGQAEQFLILNGWLHKSRTPNYHAQTLDGKNGGDAWSSEDSIGDASGQIQMMLGLNNNVVYAKDEGIINLDGSGNLTDVYPELQTLKDSGNGWHAFVWNNGLCYPTLHGELFILKEGRVYVISPALQQERLLEVSPAEHGYFAGRVRAMTGTPSSLYAEIIREYDDKHRIVVCEQVGGTFVWRTLLELDSTVSDELWITSSSTSGPVLWASTGTDQDYKLMYWILSAGPDPLQDGRMRYTPDGILYEPWLDMGCATTPKRWATMELEAYASTEQTISIQIWGDNGEEGMNRTIAAGPGQTQASLRFLKGFHTRRCRVEIGLSTDDSEVTPVLVSYRIHAFAMPEAVRIFEFTINCEASGPTWGLATQKEMRAFLDLVRDADYPMMLTDIYGTDWPVISFPPPPAEQAIAITQNRWDEVYHLALIEQVTREWEIAQEAPEEEPEEPPPTLPSYAGRVYLFGVDKDQAPVFLKTEDFSAANPTWTALSVTGLPAAIQDNPIVQFDPFAEDETGMTTAVVRTVNNADGVHELYKNTDIRNVGSTWTKIFDATIAKAAYDPGLVKNMWSGEETVELTKIEISRPQFTIAAEGFLGVVVHWVNSGSYDSGVHAFYYSADGGPTWNGTHIRTGWPSEGTGDLAIDQHNADIIHVYLERTGRLNPWNSQHLSFDGGESFSFRAGRWGAYENIPAGLHLPYEGNANCMFCWSVTGDGPLVDLVYYTENGWLTRREPTVRPQFTSYSYNLPFKVRDSDSDYIVWADHDEKLHKSTDGLQTDIETAITYRPSHRDCIAQVDEGWIYAYQGAAGVHRTFLSTDWESNDEHTGNLMDFFDRDGSDIGTLHNLTPDFLAGVL